jgi:hypothetical protein
MDTRLGTLVDTSRFILDSNIFILLFNGRLADPLPVGDLAYSAITEIEVLSFSRLSESEAALIRRFLSSMTVYSIDPAIKDKTIQLRRNHRLKLPDAIIAATAMVHNAILLTHDEQLYGIPDLTCQKLVLKP